MASEVTLNLSRLSDPAKTTDEDYRSLRAAVRSDRLTRLVGLRHTVKDEYAELATTGSPFGLAWDVLRSCSPEQLGTIVDTPYFGAWLSTAEALIGRDAHRRLPGGHAEAHLGRLGTFALQVSTLLPTPASLSFRLPRHPAVFLDAQASLVLELNPRHSAEQVTIVVDGPCYTMHARGEVVTVADLAAGTASGGASLHVLPAANGVLLDSVAPTRDHGAADRRFLQRRDVDPREWTQMMSSAITTLGAVSRPLARDVTAVVTRLVPLVSLGNGAVLNHTSEAMFGLVATSLPTDANCLAEVLVHEAQHSKLHVLERVARLIDRRANDSPDLYSPWRDDPRPATAVVHGAYSFAAVAELWLAIAGAADESYADAASAHANRRAQQVLHACEVLHASGRLAPDGDALVECLSIRARAALQHSGSLTSSTRRRIARSLADHRRAFDVSDRRAQPLAALSPASRTPPEERSPLADVLATLDAPDGIPTNAAGHGAIRRDPTAGALGRLSVTDPALVAQMQDTISSLGDGADERSLEILLGHLAYLARDFELALDHYRSALTSDHADIDRWADIAFTLRHLGRDADFSIVTQDLDRWAASNTEQLQTSPVGHLLTQPEPTT